MDFKVKFGEMSALEREKLYNYVLNYKPKIVLECGTGEGASTYYMTNALNDGCEIYSCDPFRKPHFNSDKLHFYKTTSNVLIKYMLENNILPNFIFFDGPEEPEIALYDFIELDKVVKIGTIFSMHDWYTEKRKYDGAISTKAKLLKPYINSLSSWNLIEETNANYNDNEDWTVGICFYEKIK